MEDLERVEQLLFKDNINEAIDLLNAISTYTGSQTINSFICIFFPPVNAPAKGEEAIKVKELAITKLGQTQAKHEMAEGKSLIIIVIYIYLFASFYRFI